jgi:hypothetical protein
VAKAGPRDAFPTFTERRLEYSRGDIAMECDQVFKILTRGPFPTGEPWDEQVEAHLETCADCWRLAEALRPALEVVQEAIPPAESRNLPGYWGDARPVSGSLAELACGTTRTALAAGARRLKRPHPAYERNAATREFSADILRTIALAATMTAAALALVVLFRG